MALLGSHHLFSVYLRGSHVDLVSQAKCILCRQVSTLGTICLVVMVSHTLPRNPGSKMRPFAIISCLERRTRKIGIRKVSYSDSILVDTTDTALSPASVCLRTGPDAF
jgi:hypothetical protein